MHLGQRHQMLRRRGLVRTRPHRLVRTMDALAYLASFASFFFTLDQVRIIWVEHTVAGVSLLAWTFYTVSACVWLGYGLVHRERIIIIVNGAACITNALIVAGILAWR
jgi:uncharacterized protein with PQ loop repeat